MTASMSSCSSRQSAMPDRRRAARIAFVAIVVALLPAMVITSRDFGATWDEPQQRAKGQHLLTYLTGESPVLIDPIDGAHLYGAPLDLVCAALERVLTTDPYVVRHMAIATTGWLGIVLCGLLANRLLGPPHGLLAMVLLAACPIYMAHSMNNPKDIPFATAATAFLLALTRVNASAPFLSWRLVLVLALIVGASLNVRPGALLFVAYLIVLVLFRIVSTPPLHPRMLARTGLHVAAVVVGAVAIGWVTWPWAYADPFGAPFKALIELGHFGWGGTVLFNGDSYRGTSLPLSYVPQGFWLVLPPVVLIGLVLSLLRLRDSSISGRIISLWGAVLFPIVYVIGTHATVYDGIRHLLFVLPPAMILASAGWVGAWGGAPQLVRPAAVLALSIGLFEPLLFQWRNHPNQTAYIQPLAGGPRAAYARYDLDYWGNSMLEAVSRLDRMMPGKQLYVSGWPLIVLQADLSRFPRMVLTEPDDSRATYFVRLARGTRGELLKLAASKDLVVRVTTADGALLCTVAPKDPLLAGTNAAPTDAKPR
jgi:hypothetical protein